jgi:serine/threonine protein kinase
VRVKPSMNVTGPIAEGTEYHLLEQIGDGGAAVVYRAMDGAGRTVAVKAPRPGFAADSRTRRRLGGEAMAMMRVNSPYVARLLDARLGEDHPFIVTEYVPGVNLRQLVETYGPLTGSALTVFAGRLAEALAAVHRAGIAHRDLKPSNVMVLGGAPILIDFGIANETGTTQPTRRGSLTGTPGYLAPELIEEMSTDTGPGEQRITEAADVFCWAATVAFAATGRPPFGSGSLHGVCFRILRGAADLEGVPESLETILRLGLRRDPAVRPPAAWLAARLERPVAVTV